jgi:hypothetical protein
MDRREYLARYREKHRERLRAYANAWRAANIDKVNAWSREQHKQTRSALRARVLELLGSKCAQCGFDNPLALHVDHVNGGGCRDRRGKGTTIQHYRKWINEILDGSGDYQCLCANCNTIKARTSLNERAGAPRKNKH